jgi:hypothetical protein
LPFAGFAVVSFFRLVNNAPSTMEAGRTARNPYRSFVLLGVGMFRGTTRHHASGRWLSEVDILRHRAPRKAAGRDAAEE